MSDKEPEPVPSLTRLRQVLNRAAGHDIPAPGLTAAQVWYVARVYPERVTDVEAREPYEKEVQTEADRSYWEVAARVLNELGREKE